MLSKISSPKILVPLIIVIAIIIGGGIYMLNRDTNQTVSITKTRPSSKIDYSPPTEAQKHAAGAEQNGQTPTGNTNPSPANVNNNPAGKTSVTVTINLAYQSGNEVIVRGFVSGVIENDGTCTLSLTNGTETVTSSAPGKANASSTTCSDNSVPTSKLSPGTWQASLSYSSENYSGTSSQVAVHVKS